MDTIAVSGAWRGGTTAVLCVRLGRHRHFWRLQINGDRYSAMAAEIFFIIKSLAGTVDQDAYVSNMAAERRRNVYHDGDSMMGDVVGVEPLTTRSKVLP